MEIRRTRISKKMIYESFGNNALEHGVCAPAEEHISTIRGLAPALPTAPEPHQPLPAWEKRKDDN
jgi:hypothetical protein